MEDAGHWEWIIYDIWLKNRSGKGRGGVMIMTRKGIRVERVDISKNKSEIVQVEVKNGKGKTMIYTGVYVPPLTNAWTRNDHEMLLGDTLNELERIIPQEKDVLIIGDFNCKDINWKDGTCQGGENSWSNRLMNWARENLMTQ